MISAKVIADSIYDTRLTTMEVTMHRFVLPEFNTHRVFSRSSASSRAIPIEKQIEKVVNDPAYPIEFGRNQSGMQAGEPFEGDDLDLCHYHWREACDAAVRAASHLADIGVHKQVTNRLLEPFMWHTVIVSSTEWDNFFAQRCSPLAQPEIRLVAEAMREALDSSTPHQLSVGDWHTPYIQSGETFDSVKDKLAVSAARCARVSYLTHDGKRDINADISLFNRLATAEPPHWSPMEHVATPDYTCDKGNFDGWLQLRHANLF